MNKTVRNQLVGHFQALATRRGKTVETDSNHHGMRLVCDGRRVPIPYKEPDRRTLRVLEKRLGLS